ncbi:MAG: Rpn family recombination-promoting nuclease/putative transposase, partial [Thiohalorhabdaceae bacterium]
MSEPGNPHDHFFKALLGEPGRARDFVRRYLPEEVTRELLVDELRPCDSAFVDRKLASHHTDLLYRAPLHSGDEAYIYFLFEHKSQPERWLVLDLLRYVLRIWEAEREAENPAYLPPIFPLVLYHGRKPWGAPRRLREVIAGPAHLQASMPELSYALMDLGTYEDAELRGAVELRVGLLALKHIFRPELRERLPGILGLMQELDRQSTGLAYLETVLRYFATGAPDLEERGLREAVSRALPHSEEDLMGTIAEQWEARGKAEGKAEDVLTVLRTRFGAVKESEAEWLRQQSAERLDRFLERAV